MADQSLIRGAYEAAGGGIPNYNLAKSKALKDIGDAGAKLASKFGEQVKKRQKEFDENIARRDGYQLSILGNNLKKFLILSFTKES